MTSTMGTSLQEAALDRLAERFHEQFRADGRFADAGGWGQFLDALRPGAQIGPYGTCAGIIVLALSGGLDSGDLNQASRLLSGLWQARTADSYSVQRYAQTLRVALMNLALRLARSPISSAVEQELLRRMLASGMWGNYWSAPELRHETPSVFVTSLVILSFTLFRDSAAHLDKRIPTAANALESRLEASADLSPYERAAAAAAVVSVKGEDISKSVRRVISTMGLSLGPSLGERGNYFFDYEYEVNGDRCVARDYFVAPTALLLGIAGWLRGAPSSLRLKAETLLPVVRANLSANRGALRLYEGERLSTVDQLWCAVFLRSADRAEDAPSIRGRLTYGLRKARPANSFTAKVVPVVGMIVATYASAIVKPEEYFLKFLTAVAFVVISGLYGAPVIKRIIPTGE